MSLVSQALVALTHYVLDGRTWAGSRIEEQPVDPIIDLLRNAGEAQAPVIAIYVENAEFMVDGRETQGEMGNLTLKVLVYVAPGATKLPDDIVEFKLDGRQAGLTLNVVGRQIDAAFKFGNEDWIAVWRRFVVKFASRSIRYVLFEVENGVKIPAMEVTYECKSIPDPDIGTPVYGAWLDLDTALRTAGGEKAILADLITGMIENPTGLPDYQLLQANFGLTDSALAATGLGPVPGAVDDDEEIVELEEITNAGTTIIVPEDEP